MPVILNFFAIYIDRGRALLPFYNFPRVGTRAADATRRVPNLKLGLRQCLEPDAFLCCCGCTDSGEIRAGR